MVVTDFFVVPLCPGFLLISENFGFSILNMAYSFEFWSLVVVVWILELFQLSITFFLC